MNIVEVLNGIGMLVIFIMCVPLIWNAEKFLMEVVDTVRASKFNRYFIGFALLGMAITACESVLKFMLGIIF